MQYNLDVQTESQDRLMQPATRIFAHEACKSSITSRQRPPPEENCPKSRYYSGGTLSAPYSVIVFHGGLRWIFHGSVRCDPRRVSPPSNLQPKIHGHPGSRIRITFSSHSTILLSAATLIPRVCAYAAPVIMVWRKVINNSLSCSLVPSSPVLFQLSPSGEDNRRVSK
jgi:hypothetical protein